MPEIEVQRNATIKEDYPIRGNSEIESIDYEKTCFYGWNPSSGLEPPMTIRYMTIYFRDQNIGKMHLHRDKIEEHYPISLYIWIKNVRKNKDPWGKVMQSPEITYTRDRLKKINPEVKDAILKELSPEARSFLEKALE